VAAGHPHPPAACADADRRDGEAGIGHGAEHGFGRGRSEDRRGGQRCRDGVNDQAALARLAALAAAYGPDEVIIGEPKRTDGKASAQTARVAAFLERLREIIPARFILTDERYSTQEAREIMAARRGGAGREHDDAVAAAVILQRHLDQARPEPDDAWEAV
jgi:putative transcription antitermination factor YqgF